MSAPNWKYLSDNTLDAILVATRVFQASADDGSDDLPRSRKQHRSDVEAPKSTSPDVEMFERLRAGDRAALDELYRGTYADLCQFAYTYVRATDLADEIVQDVFVTLMARETRLPADGTIRGYLFASVRNRALNAIRFVKRTSHTHEWLIRDAASGVLAASAQSADETIAIVDMKRAVARAVQTLPERQQRAVLLRYAARLSFGDIALALNVSTDAARMLVNRATADLRERLATHIDDLTA